MLGSIRRSLAAGARDCQRSALRANTDQTGALTLAGDVMAALFARERTGKSQKVDASIYGTRIVAQGFESHSRLAYREKPARAARGHPFIHGV
jgi:crotonobetainyl-CoA:carnitine CoA-transferase CaiB-like acyl-CoA transferase